ncbi:TetR/AcrR family transcriptional regulator [Paraburkholderia bryophila]|uniref:AcrR family transcriptional regulator n=1 Tax=Paraburkholderia bryophila TaxID=420952 RepID=A0A7Y9WL54_9BURK|nr:TetR/AcrR family transcriptional regulator [Paraburkholderia bryophila]NYH22854.1 AcrR family transcriptional regulator [Paraburkholderia bryophila]
MPDPDPSGRRARKQIQTQALLAETAIRLFETHGFDTVTMEQIAAGADVAKGTLYNHFATKEAVLAHWIHAQLQADLVRLQQRIARQTTFVAALSLLLDASAAWCEKHGSLLLPYIRFRFLSLAPSAGRDDAASKADMTDGFALLIAKGQAAGELRDDLPAAHLAALFHHLYLGALMRWLTLPGLKLKREFAAVVDLFVNGASTSTTLTDRRAGKS